MLLQTPDRRHGWPSSSPTPGCGRRSSCCWCWPGLVSVPKYLYEAAEIDRASWWRKFRTITFPYIRGLLLLALLFRTIEAFKLFDLPFLLTNGGPGTSTETIAVYLYRMAFQYFRDQRERGARLHPAVHRDRADQSLSLLRQPPRAGGLSDGGGVGGRSARPAGAGRSGPASSASSISSRCCGSSSPPSRPTTTRWRCRRSGCSRRPSRTSSRSSSAPTASAPKPQTPASACSSSTRSSSPAPACSLALDHRHARRLRLLALSAQGQRHLPVHHPVDPHDAGDRGDHPDLPDVPRRPSSPAPIPASSCSTPPSTCRSRSG